MHALSTLLKRASLAAVILLSACASAPLQPVAHTAAHPALEYRRYAPWPDSLVHVLRVDLRHPGLRIALTPEAQRGRIVSDFAGHAEALAVVNASFFNAQFAPRGWTRSEGGDWPDASGVHDWAVFACSGPVSCEVALPPVQAAPAWRTVVAGIPALLHQGQDVSEQGCASRRKFCSDTHPRTAIGLADGGKTLLLVVAEGRQPPVLGMTIPQLVQLMRTLGATEALNLDGGGSSTLSVQGQQRMGRPNNEPQLRKVANALMVLGGAAP
ncbi:phosphodiester glycosidase family protein [Massilia sp. TS11]|uniref:phosphodiester glycosidase family protein n=1 Tax=Massilia sp. TS11 TaxID=2908003 RepID=UPI001EDC1ADB|nr:phosphodiester glycosidase family protein [Massilia sp. TS11]MCG2583066.1 phosphodiester glycosidase family protein [Massilia sp. TS11]